MARRRKRRTVDPSNCSLLELAVARTGSMLRGAKVCAFVTAWGIARRDLGHEPTMDEYAAYWKIARSSAYDERTLFRVVFPELDTPGPVVDLLEARRAQQSDRLTWRPLVAA